MGWILWHCDNITKTNILMNNEKDSRPLPILTRKHLSACPIVHRGHVLSPAIGIYFINRGHPRGASRTKIVWIIFLMGLLHPLPRQTEHKKPRRKKLNIRVLAGFWDDLGQWSVISWSWMTVCVLSKLLTHFSGRHFSQLRLSVGISRVVTPRPRGGQSLARPPIRRDDGVRLPRTEILILQLLYQNSSITLSRNNQPNLFAINLRDKFLINSIKHYHIWGMEEKEKECNLFCMRSTIVSNHYISLAGRVPWLCRINLTLH